MYGPPSWRTPGSSPRSSRHAQKRSYPGPQRLLCEATSPSPRSRNSHSSLRRTRSTSPFDVRLCGDPPRGPSWNDLFQQSTEHRSRLLVSEALSLLQHLLRHPPWEWNVSAHVLTPRSMLFLNLRQLFG